MTNKGPRLTEKKMANRRFRKTEGAIRSAFLKERFKSICRITKRAKISRYTFYYHHKSESEIIRDYQIYILKKYRQLIRDVLKRKDIDLKNIYFQVLIFILREKEIFLFLKSSNEKEVFYKMIDELRAKISQTEHIPDTNPKVFDIYRAEVVSILENWGKENFTQEKLSSTLSNILVMSNRIWERFGNQIR